MIINQRKCPGCNKTITYHGLDKNIKQNVKRYSGKLCFSCTRNPMSCPLAMLVDVGDGVWQQGSYYCRYCPACNCRIDSRDLIYTKNAAKNKTLCKICGHSKENEIKVPQFNVGEERSYTTQTDWFQESEHGHRPP